ncbi:uncharacterized protein ISCGN_019132 [Ixodes scapularis]
MMGRMPYSTHFVSQVAGVFLISLVLGLPAAPNISPPQGGCKASVCPPQIIQPSVAFSTSPSTTEAIPLFGWQHSPHHVQFGAKRGVPGVLQKHGRDYRHFGHDTELRMPYSTHFVSQVAGAFIISLVIGLPAAPNISPPQGGCKASVCPPQIIQPSVAFSTSPSITEAIQLFGWQHSPHHVQFGAKRGVPGVLQKHGRDYRHFGHDTELRMPYSTHFVSQVAGVFLISLVLGLPAAPNISKPQGGCKASVYPPQIIQPSVAFSTSPSITEAIQLFGWQHSPHHVQFGAKRGLPGVLQKHGRDYRHFGHDTELRMPYSTHFVSQVAGAFIISLVIGLPAAPNISPPQGGCKASVYPPQIIQPSVAFSTSPSTTEAIPLFGWQHSPHHVQFGAKRGVPGVLQKHGRDYPHFGHDTELRMPYSSHFVSQVAGAFIISLVLGLPAAPNINPLQGGCKASAPQIIHPSVAFSTSPSTTEAIPLFGWQHRPHHVQFGAKRGVPGVLQKHGRDYRHFGHDTELKMLYSTHFISPALAFYPTLEPRSLSQRKRCSSTLSQDKRRVSKRRSFCGSGSTQRTSLTTYYAYYRIANGRGHVAWQEDHSNQDTLK